MKLLHTHVRRTAALVVGAGIALALTSAPAAAGTAPAPQVSAHSAAAAKLLASLKDPAATSDDTFGAAVSISGTTAVVGAPRTNSVAGAAYIYVKSKTGWGTSPVASLADPAATSSDEFGFAVSISGTTAIVGAFGTNSYAGAAYIYIKSKTGWGTSPVASLADPAAASQDYFGYAVAISGATAIVGARETNSQAGAAYIYAKSKTGWGTTPVASLADPAATSNDYFGYAVAISGATAIVGAPGNNTNTGAAYIYAKSKSGWGTTPVASLADPAATSNDYFGSAVSIYGTTAIVGAKGNNTNTGAAYIYAKSKTGWGTTPVASLADPAATSNDYFGSAVSIYGATAIVGAYVTNSHAGAAHIYVKSKHGWGTSPAASLADPAATSSDEFGFAVSISGTTAIVGAFGTNSSAGAAYIYKA